MQDITVKDAEKYGIQNKHSLLKTGEKRFRQFCATDNTAYIRAEGPNKGYWQRSHYHKTVREIYIVQKGTILLAEYINNKMRIRKFEEGGIFVVEPNIPHNVYMCPNVVSHTVKYIDNKNWINEEENENTAVKIRFTPKNKYGGSQWDKFIAYY